MTLFWAAYIGGRRVEHSKKMHKNQDSGYLRGKNGHCDRREHAVTQVFSTFSASVVTGFALYFSLYFFYTTHFSVSISQ
jgi:hypothetical protein